MLTEAEPAAQIAKVGGKGIVKLVWIKEAFILDPRLDAPFGLTS